MESPKPATDNRFKKIEKFLAVAFFKMVAKIKHCPISSKFDMWVDNAIQDVEIEQY
jgi:hypothetical protein